MNPTSFSLGSSHTFFADSNGKLWSLGCNTDGQLGAHFGAKREVHHPDNLTNIEKALQVACGSHHTLIIDAEERLWCFGNGGDGRLGNNDIAVKYEPQQLPNIMHPRSISAGWRHSGVIDGRGILWMFGCNSNGQLGMGDTLTRGSPSLIMEIDKAYQVSCGGKHTAVIDCFGNLWTFGDNYQGQLGFPDWHVIHKPAWVSQVPNARFVSAGWEHTAVIDMNNDLWTFGLNDNGQLGLGDETGSIPSNFTPTRVMSNIKTVACGGTHTIAIDFNGNVYSCGNNSEGQCGHEDTRNYRSFTKIESLPPSDSVACNQGSIVLDRDGKLWGFGANCCGELGQNLSDFDKKGAVITKKPEVIENLQMYLPYTRVKSSRNVIRR